ncbi:MAG: hypothetical protein HOQ36_07135 [Nocardia sp.]|nr:hypothetical protein [Nocardia sp.]
MRRFSLVTHIEDRPLFAGHRTVAIGCRQQGAARIVDPGGSHGLGRAAADAATARESYPPGR